MSREKRSRSCEGFYRTVEDGVHLKNERIPRERSAKVDNEMYEIEVRCFVNYMRYELVMFYFTVVQIQTSQ